VPALLEVFKSDKDDYIRLVAVTCLGYGGNQAKSAVPVLKQGLNDLDSNIRYACLAALKRIEIPRNDPREQERISRDQAILKEIAEFKRARLREK
jgi:HEAT repeat protein